MAKVNNRSFDPIEDRAERIEGLTDRSRTINRALKRIRKQGRIRYGDGVIEAGRGVLSFIGVPEAEGFEFLKRRGLLTAREIEVLESDPKLRIIEVAFE